MTSLDDNCLPVGCDDGERVASSLTDPCAPLAEKDLAMIEALCEASASGPFVIHDDASRKGVVVATLPDGRHVVSLGSDRASADPARIQANARLICQARLWLLRLLRDRLQWQAERDLLLARIACMEPFVPRRNPDSHAIHPR